MIRPSDIRPFRWQAEDHHKTTALIDAFRRERKRRSPFYLTPAELDKVYHWKLRDQYPRGRKHRDSNTVAAIRAVTEAAFCIDDDGSDYELEVRVGILTSLRGVGVPVASAILTLVEPRKYCVVDFRAWRQAFGEEKQYFTVGDYKRYLAEVRRLAGKLGWTPQEVDEAIWVRDQKHPPARS